MRRPGNCGFGGVVAKIYGRAIGLIAVSLMLAPCVTTAMAADKPTLVNAPTLIADQTSSATAQLILRNSGQQELKKGALYITDFISKTTGQPLGSRPAFSPAGASQAGGQVLVLEKMAPGDIQIVKIDVSNLWEAGESTADILYDGEKIGALKGLKYQVPFAVSLQTASADGPAVTLQKGRSVVLMLKNDDAMTYPVQWELDIAGKKADGTTTIPPKNVVAVKPLNDAWLDLRRGLFKDELQDGLLTLHYPATSASGAPVQVKTYPLKVRLWSPPIQQVWSTVIIFIVLALGGICSLLVSYWVPNRLRRRDLIAQLNTLTGKIRTLSPHIKSSLRVLVRVQNHRLFEMLFSRWTLSPDLAITFTQCSSGIAMLDRHVGLLQYIDTAYGQLGTAAQALLPPSLLDTIRQKLLSAETCLESPEPAEGDFQMAQDLTKDAKARLLNLNQPDPAFAQELANRVKKLQAAKLPACDPFGHPYQRLLAFLASAPTDIAGINPSYSSLDTNTAQLTVIQDFIELSGSNPDVSQAQELATHLSHTSWQELRVARRIVREISEGASYDDIMTKLQAEALEIAMDSNVVRPYFPVQFSASFLRTALNGAAACEEFTCTWNFGHDGLQETGWKVSHYFPSRPPKKVFRLLSWFKKTPPADEPALSEESKGRNSYTVAVSFQDKNEQPVKINNGKVVSPERKITVQPDQARSFDRLWTEVIYLAIVLFTALLALVGGAREQLAKMDVVPGLIGVFVLGFTADQIKNLLTQRTTGGRQQ